MPGGERLSQEKKTRLITAMRGGRPDRVPLRVFAAEFCAQYAGFSIQAVTHDFENAFEAVRRCAADFHWDATLPNPIYVWTGMAEAMGLRYFRIPGIDLPPDVGFQYCEPSRDEQAYMRESEYDLLIRDPTQFLADVWLPRVCRDFAVPGAPNTFRNNAAWLKAGIGLMMMDAANAAQIERLADESGTVSAISGSLIAPFDLLANKLRGFRQLAADVHRCPQKVLAACEALQPHLLQYALSGADPNRELPVALWLHRGTLFSDRIYEEIFWPTLKEIICELWKQGIQTLWYAEGKWTRWLRLTSQLPEHSIVYHVDKDDIFEVRRQVGGKFCLSGGVPNDLLAFGTREEVVERCRKVIEGVAREGGYLMDAAAAIQQDARVENVRAMTEATLDYGTC